MTPRERLEELLALGASFNGQARIEELISSPRGPVFCRTTTLDGRGRFVSEGTALAPGTPAGRRTEGEWRPNPYLRLLPPEATVDHLGSVIVAGRDAVRFQVRFPGLDPVWLFGEDRADRYLVALDTDTGYLLDAIAYRRRRLLERRQVIGFET